MVVPSRERIQGHLSRGPESRTFVITVLIVVPFFVVCTTKTHVIVHLYPKLRCLIVFWAQSEKH